MNLPGYNIQHEIGSGGMATVYLAIQESLHRNVALKVMSPALAADRSYTNRFLKEARTIASLMHPHIVPIYDVGVVEYYHYLALEYIPGGDLKQRIRQGMSRTAVLDVVRQIAGALSHAHSKGIIHRDVKPQNILFREDGSAVLTDFGIARAADAHTRITGTGMSIGTPHYMSPEQARGTKVDGRADLYALGIVLYEMLTGKVPYDAEETLAICFKHVTEPVPVLPPALAGYQPIIDRMLAKDPNDRYQTAEQLVQAIDSHDPTVKPRTSGSRPTRVMPTVGTAQAASKAGSTARPGGGLKWASVGGIAAVGALGFVWLAQQKLFDHTGGGVAPIASQAVAPVASVKAGGSAPAKTDSASAAVATVAQSVVVKIGHAGPTTGPQAHLGKDNENGARLAIDDANAKNIVIDGKKIKFELDAQDDQADPRQATIVARKLVDDKVAGVVGHLNSGTSIPASRIYNEAGIPEISPSATNPKLTLQGFKNVFRVMANDVQQGRVIGKAAVETLGGQKLAIIDDRTAYGAGIAGEAENAARASGATIVAHEYTNYAATDFKAILSKIKAKKPDVIMYGGMDAQGGPMVKQMKELGIKAKYIAGDGVCSAEWPKLAGGAAEGQYCTQAGVPPENMANAKDFVTRFTGKYGPIQVYAPYSYDAAMTLIAAMQKANSTDPANYLPELAKISYDGVTAKIEFDEHGDTKNGAITLYQVKDGMLVPRALLR